jgi:ATP-binding cassette subfamily B protein
MSRKSINPKKVRRIRNKLFLKHYYLTSIKSYSKDFNFFHFLKYLLSDHKLSFSFYLFASIVVVIFDFTINPVFSKVIIDSIQQYSGSREYIWEVVRIPITTMLIVWICNETVARLGAIVESSILDPSLNAKIKITHLDRMMRNSYEYFVNNEVGKITSGMYSILYLTRAILKQATTHLIPNFLACLTLALSFFAIHKYLAFIIIFHLLLTVITLKFLVKKAIILSGKVMKSHSKTISAITDIIINISSTILFCRQKDELNRVKRIQNFESKRIQASSNYIEIIKVIFSFYIIAILGLLYISVEIHLYKTSQINLSDIIYGVSATGGYCALLYFVQMDLLDIIEQYGNLQRAIATMNEGEVIAEVSSGYDLKLTEGTIEFNNISFGYEDDDIFEKENLIIKPKEKVGLVGRSGSGKTTFINLLLRNLQLDSGKITIDGQDIALVSEESLKKNIAVISQDTSLFNRTIIENIRYGKPDATFQEVIIAAKKANAHEFISELDNGYDTMAGEKGSKLSGGQRQRIIIARAILKNAPILILDEATSALDAESEEVIHASLLNLMEGKTVIAIAHRLTTLKDMDRIIVLQEGEVVEQGTHDQLIEKNGSIYHKLWHIQRNAILDL